MREDYDRGAGREGCEIFLQPIELLHAKDAESAFMSVHHINQADEVHAALVKAIPARPKRVLPEALPVLGAVIAQHVMLAGT